MLIEINYCPVSREIINPDTGFCPGNCHQGCVEKILLGNLEGDYNNKWNFVPKNFLEIGDIVRLLKEKDPLGGWSYNVIKILLNSYGYFIHN